MAEPARAADLGTLVARFGAALNVAGLPVGPDRSERFARAVVVAGPRTVQQLYCCALATLTSDPADVEVLDRVFGAVFGGLVDDAEWRGAQRPAAADDAWVAAEPGRAPGRPGAAARGVSGTSSSTGGPGSGAVPVPAVASEVERLAGRDFGELAADELAELTALMARFRVATPPRKSRRYRAAPHGRLVDLRDTLRAARRTAGDPLAVHRRRRRHRPRRLVVLCDISGSMEPYARAMLQLLYCARGGAQAEVFTFATRLTRLTAALRAGRNGPAVAVALRRAGELAPDWSGGTRIGAALRGFNDTYGRPGMARGAVVLIISDGWETGDAAELEREMARLARVAHRIVWANPRTARAGYEPRVGGMAAALPYCDAVVSAHRLDALDELLTSLADPRPRATRRGRRIPAGT